MRKTHDPELEEFKSMNLGHIAQVYGYIFNKSESSPSSQVFKHPDGDKIIIATGEDGHAVFFNIQGTASGSVIDFIMHREHCNLGYARQYLRRLVNIPSPTAPAFVSVAKPKIVSRDLVALSVQWASFGPYQGQYLQGRGLTAATLTHVGDRLRQDGRGNACFRHDNAQRLAGWEVKNKGFTGYPEGGEKALFAARMGLEADEIPPRLIVAESAIDGLSYWQMNPAPALVLSFAGSMTPEQGQLLARVLRKYHAAEVITATDNDTAGDRYADQVQETRPDATRARPPAGVKDWNEALQKAAGIHPQQTKKRF